MRHGYRASGWYAIAMRSSPSRFTLSRWPSQRHGALSPLDFFLQDLQTLFQLPHLFFQLLDHTAAIALGCRLVHRGRRGLAARRLTGRGALRKTVTARFAADFAAD